MTSTEIDKAVLRFRKECGLKSVDYKSLFKAAEKLGFTVIEFGGTVNDINVKNLIEALGLEAQTELTKGFTYVQGDYRLVFINAALSEREKTIVISHELGHIVLGHIGHRSFTGQDVQDEYEANEFSHFLLKSDNKLFVVLSCYKGAVITAAAVIIILTAVTLLLTSPGLKAKVFGISSANETAKPTETDYSVQEALPTVAVTEPVTEPSTEGVTEAPSEQIPETTAPMQTVYVPVPVTEVPATEKAKPASTAPHTTKPAATKPATTKPPTTRPHTPEDDFGSSALYAEIKAELKTKYAEISPDISYDSDKHIMNIIGTLPEGMYDKLNVKNPGANEWWYPVAEGAITDAAETHSRIAAQELNVDCFFEIHADNAPDTTVFRTTNGVKPIVYKNYYDFHEAPGGNPAYYRSLTETAESTENQ